jgi:AraC-like DNA-binding protein
MSVVALDLGCRGAAVGLFLLIVGILLRDRPASPVARLGAALAAGATAHAICAAPAFAATRHWWPLPLLVLSWGTPIVFWLWARTAFNDEFVLRRWHGALWAAVAGFGLLVSYGKAAGPVPSAAVKLALSVMALGVALSAALQTLTTWRADLLAGRRRLRVVVLIGTIAYIVTSASADLVPASPVAQASFGGVADGFGLFILALLCGWNLFQVAGSDRNSALIQVTGDGLDDARHIIPADDDKRPAIEPALLRRLEHLMTVDRTYRQEGLTTGTLASKLNLPEYRLRKLINEGLGYRNFNVFLNRYRIEEAKQALNDREQKDVPVLTIAMDAGFQSIGPFNRAFKADTGQTPTEYRRAALARPPGKRAVERDNPEIGHSN